MEEIDIPRNSLTAEQLVESEAGGDIAFTARYAI